MKIKKQTIGYNDDQNYGCNCHCLCISVQWVVDIFYNDVTFKDASFQRTIFGKSEFYGDITFRNPTFKDDIGFILCAFENGFEFSNIVSPNPIKANFSYSRIGPKVPLKKYASIRASFSKAKLKEAYFRNVEFNIQMIYDRVEVDDAVDFEQAKFNHEIKFSNCILNCNLDLSGFEFKQPLSFISSKLQEANFSRCKFVDQVKFLNSEIHGRANFQAIFNRDVWFSSTKFKQAVVFGGVSFHWLAYFDQRVF